MTTNNQNSHVAGAVPAGWQLVPATPTREWIASVADGGYEDCDCASLIADILSRAPAAPQAPDEMSDAEAHQRHYRGNSVSYIKQKLDVYRGAIDRAFDVLRGAGHHPDGKTELAELIRAALAAAHQAPAAPMDDLAQLVKQLVQALRKAAPNHVLPAKALDYLRRQGLQGSPLRAAPAAPAVDALAPVQALLDMHAELLDANPYAYFELAYTRQTGWMAWITDKPFHGPVINPDRKVLARGQGDTAAAACAAAAQAKEGGDAA